MDMLGYMAEIILVSFLIGAVMGGVVTAHMLARTRQTEMNSVEAVPAKVKVKR